MLNCQRGIFCPIEGMDCLCFRRGQSKTLTQQIVDEGAYNVKFYTFKQLRDATQNFSRANKIGEGGFGSVFKGRLSDGKEIAVKVLSAESRQGLPEFLTELRIIADIEHENLVKLHGCCADEDHQILVYGYLPNNSLDHTLLLGGSGNRSIRFTWETRKRIAIGVAKGLAYLHEELNPHIIHRDIKASNILLDKDLNAKISDFGLAKLIGPNMTHVSTRVAGTLGYLAPEYAIHGHLNRKADIYSYGVLLLEIISGCRGRERWRDHGEQHLLSRLVNVVDESLRVDLNAEEAIRFFKVAFLCTQGMPKDRPSMSTVVQMLQGDTDVTKLDVSKPGLLLERANMHSKGNPIARNNIENSPSCSTSDNESKFTYPTLTFTSISERSL
ncbi:hypothetical protein V2J09_018951 [Rumex salicifolius]